MKLISLYIENFGGLSRYSLNFADGLTVIQEENGFGKTTLAEFIRAMFYGFPRKTKTLDKSKRQKYLPWNGGKCGGNLVFEFEGQRYRIERTFGTTPKGDSFKLIDLATNKKSDRFSEDIGLELFQLDADSFERSTYMPQLHDAGSLTTDSIQAKLGDLVEDTGDVNNFDKAVAALKAKRIGYQLFRGVGGTVAEAQSQITRLQRELDEAEGKRPALEESRNEAQRLEQVLAAANQEIDAVRGEITRASEALAVAAVRGQHEDLTARYQTAAAEKVRLEERYPRGLPSEAELEEAGRAADRELVLAGQEVTTPADREAEAFLQENRSRFENKLPEQSQLDSCRSRCADYRALTTEIRSAGLSDEEQAQYEKLLPIFEAGGLAEEKLNGLAEQNRDLVKCRHTLESLSMDENDRAQLEQLKHRFAAGVPTEEELQSHRQTLTEIDTLRQENLRLAALREALPQPKGANWTVPVMLAVLSVAGIAAGVVLLVKQIYVYGGVALGAGVLALIIAVFLGLRQMVSKELSGVERYRISPETQAKIDENERKIASVEAALLMFADRYTREGTPAERLHEIKDLREDLLALRGKQAAMEEKRTVLMARAAAMEETLRSGLKPCFGRVTDFEKAIVNLQLVRSQFLTLQAEKNAADVKIADLTARAEAIRVEIAGFLGAYYGNVTEARFEDLLAALQRESDAYTRAGERVAQWQARKAQHEKETQECAELLDGWFSRWGVARSGDARAQLRQLRGDMEDFEAVSGRMEALASELAAFEADHARELAAPVSDQPDLNELKDREAGLAGRINLLTRQLLEQRQHSRNLRAQVDRIPEIRDELARWQETRTADLKKAQTLDDTVIFLQKAKDSLSLRYLAPIRDSFACYMERLAGESTGQILVSPDLQVQLERLGEARELAYFSAGQTDTVMLCMRLALVDALFREAKPFVILDDPFVNLDDRRTAEALALLRELAKERQIIYLVCNSSRNFQ